ADFVRLLDFVEPDLTQDARGRDVGFLEVTRARLRYVLLRRLEAKLQRIVAVRGLAPDPDDRAGAGLDHGDRHVVAVVAEDLRHADLAADERFFPSHYSLISTSTPAGKSSFISESTVCGVGSTMSSRRLCVRISNCSREVLSTCGERSTVQRLMIVGSNTGPATRAPVRRTVSTISLTDRSRR